METARAAYDAKGDLVQLDRRIDDRIEAEGLVVARDLPIGVPGIGKDGAENPLAEIGADMSVIDTPQALASWVGVAPGSPESAGRKHAVKARPGDRCAKATMGIAATLAACGPQSDPGAYRHHAGNGVPDRPGRNAGTDPQPLPHDHHPSRRRQSPTPHHRPHATTITSANVGRGQSLAS